MNKIAIGELLSEKPAMRRSAIAAEVEFQK
jgi:hypothetical protein